LVGADGRKIASDVTGLLLIERPEAPEGFVPLTDNAERGGLTECARYGKHCQQRSAEKELFHVHLSPTGEMEAEL
jgi:hypothetical protein